MTSDYLCKVHPTIIIFSDSFPLGGFTEESFIMPELNLLAEKYEKVYIVPTTSVGERNNVELPENVVVVTEWVDSLLHKNKLFRLLKTFSADMLRDCSGNYSRKSIAHSVASHAFALWLRKWILQNKIDCSNTLFYSFWFDVAAMGVAIVARNTNLHSVIRCHYHDILSGLTPRLRRSAVETAVCVYAVSQWGVDYLKNEFPQLQNKIKLSLLGSLKLDKQALSHHHSLSDKKITFLSVARVCEQKRVDLNYQLLKALAVARPHTQFEWMHIGDGPLLESIKTMVKESCPDNLTVRFEGSLPNSQVHKIYSTEAIDWTLLLSESEGLPIALCESLSYGVPVVCTDVQGISEAVDDECALVLAADPASEEFVRGILPFVESDYRMDCLRKGAFDFWSRCYDAESTRKEFVEELWKYLL